MGTHHMSAVDSAWLRMDNPGNLLVVNAVIWSAEPLGLRRTPRRHRRADDRPVPALPPASGSSRIPLGRAEWVDDEDFDPDRHYRYVTLHEPGDEAALQAYVSSQTGIPLDPAHPLWEVHLISGFRSGSAALFRIHHAVADGIALTRVTLSLTDDGPQDHFAEVTTRVRRASLVDAAGWVIASGLGLVRHPSRIVGLARTAGRDSTRLVHLATLPTKPRSVLSGRSATRSSSPGPPDPARRHQGDRPPHGHHGQRRPARGPRRRLGRLPGGAGHPAARGPGHGPGEPPPAGRAPAPELGNEFGFYFVDLPTGSMPPRERLAEMHRRVEEIKGSPEALVAFGVLAGLGASPKVVEDIGVAFFGSKAAGVVTNVPGPRKPVYLAGARVDGLVGWVPRAGDMGFGVSIFSYAGQVTVGFSTDAELMPDPDRLQALVLDQVATMLAIGRRARAARRPTPKAAPATA